MVDLKYFRKSFKDKPNSLGLTSDAPLENLQINFKTDFFIAGCDEVGRGPLAGPVVAACVSLHFLKYEEKEIKKLFKEWSIFGVTDSKKITSEKRQEILSDLAISVEPMTVNQIYTHSYSKNMSIKVLIKEISPQVIDQINILNASLRAMKGAVTESCDFSKDGLVLIDGNRKFESSSSSVLLEPIIKGDSKSLLIGLASIIAKEYRDQLMKKYCSLYPGYDWKQNAGYGTPRHLEGIALLGITEIHRKTFSGVKEVHEERG